MMLPAKPTLGSQEWLMNSIHHVRMLLSKSSAASSRRGARHAELAMGMRQSFTKLLVFIA
jgi:hypothetical protein